MTNKLGVGVIGANRWAQAAHLPAFAAHGQVDLVAICDVLPERARAMQAQFGAAKVYFDHRQLLADPDIQAVDVCTPTQTHLALSLDAIAAGKHVLCEKPLHTRAGPAFAAAAAAAQLDRRGRARRDLSHSWLRAEFAIPGSGLSAAPGRARRAA
jgi:predicted dehydrogenase